MQEDLLQLGQWLFYWLFRGAWLAAVWGTRGAAQLSAAALPHPKTKAEATGYAALAGGGWCLCIAAGFALGLAVGAVVGLAIAYALTKRGLAFAEAAAGGISLGQSKGRLGVATPHVIDRQTRVRHVAVFGATGSGKSTALKNLVAQDF